MANKADRARRSTSLSPKAEGPFLRISVAVVAVALAAMGMLESTAVRVSSTLGNPIDDGGSPA
jgi:hypothetical protein